MKANPPSPTKKTDPGSGEGGSPGAGSGGPGGAPKANCHSFDPNTPVLMADGATKRIEDVQIGDNVLAANPTTGVTEPKPVTELHINLDRDLTEVTIKDTATATTTILKTTANHPFWNASLDEWTEATNLKAGTYLRDDQGKETQQVVAVRTWTGLAEMRDLTVADIHTYYVVAGQTPVLVHNCGGKTPSPNPADTFDVPSSPGVYTIHLGDGSKYVGMSTTSINSRVAASVKPGHAVTSAGYCACNFVNVTWVSLPKGVSAVTARRVEQTVMEGWKALGANLVNRRDPEFSLWFH